MTSVREKESERIARLENGRHLVKTFQQSIIVSRSKNEANACNGDWKVMKSMSLPPGKRLPGKVLSNSYLFLYLTFKLAPFDADARRDFLAAKLEATRFHQWAAPADCTVTQVTPATHMHSSCEAAIETALCNIFSVTLKPIDARAFVRAVRQRFEIRLHEAFSWGPAGMFRSDVPTSMKTRRIPLDEKDMQAPSDHLHLDPEETLFAQDHFIPQNPFTAGARMLKAALTPEYSELRDDMKPFTAVEPQEITDAMLMHSPVPSDNSSESDICFEE